MSRDTPLSADQDVLVDANIFYAIGRPSNPQYQRFRSVVQHVGVICKLPQRVIGELGGSRDRPCPDSAREGWAEIIDAHHQQVGTLSRRAISPDGPSCMNPTKPNTKSRRPTRFSRGWPFNTSETARQRVLLYLLTTSPPGRVSRTPFERRGIRTRSRSADWRTLSGTIRSTRCSRPSGDHHSESPRPLGIPRPRENGPAHFVARAATSLPSFATLTKTTLRASFLRC